jgi:hypothetical protein
VKASVDNARGRLTASRPADRRACRRGRQPLQDRQTLPVRDLRWPLRLRPRRAGDQRGGSPDGFYVLRTSIGPDALTPHAVVRTYKLLAYAEQAFRGMKSAELEIRPIHHRLNDRVRAHVFLCVLAYAFRFELEQRLAPLLFKDDSPLAPADRSRPPSARPRQHRRWAARGLRPRSASRLLTPPGGRPRRRPAQSARLRGGGARPRRRARDGGAPRPPRTRSR